VLADGRCRANAGAFAASRATRAINIARLIEELCDKLSSLTFESLDFSIGNDIDIVMPADLDQFW
jgi:hypothetical protein